MNTEIQDKPQAINMIHCSVSGKDVLRISQWAKSKANTHVDASQQMGKAVDASFYYHDYEFDKLL